MVSGFCDILRHVVIQYLRRARTRGPHEVQAADGRARSNMVSSSAAVCHLHLTAFIRDLADIQSRGYLDAPAFTVAMYLVQACMSGQLNTIPPVLPQSVYEQAALSAPHAVLDAHYGTPGPSTNRGSPSSARVSSPSMAAAPEANTSTESSVSRPVTAKITCSYHFSSST